MILAHRWAIGVRARDTMRVQVCVVTVSTRTTAAGSLDSQFPLLYGNRFLTDFLSKKLKNKIAIRPVGAGCEFFSVPTPDARARHSAHREKSM